MEDLNLAIVNPLNFVVNYFTDKSIHVYLLIDLFISKGFYPSGQYTEFNNLNSYMDAILDFMAPCHLMESGPIIVSLYVWLIHHCSTTILCFQIAISAQNQPDIKVQ